MPKEINTKYVGTVTDDSWFQAIYKLPFQERKKFLNEVRRLDYKFEEGLSFVFSCVKININKGYLGRIGVWKN